MTGAAPSDILSSLERVQALRACHRADPAQGWRVAAVKDFQQRRFALTHADLLADVRHGSAAHFFLDELYGPQDFAERDAQFARIVPALVRLFPADLVATVANLARLHALTETLDDQMARHLATMDPPATAPVAAAVPGGPGRSDAAARGLPPLNAASYLRAWQATGQPDARQRQLDQVLAVGRALDHYTRNRLLHQSLRWMRGPARAAGLAALQGFLERGFECFVAMGGAEQFLARIERREQALMAALFSAGQAPGAPDDARSVTYALGQLP